MGGRMTPITLTIDGAPQNFRPQRWHRVRHGRVSPERAVLRAGDAHRAAQPHRVGQGEPEAHRAALVPLDDERVGTIRTHVARALRTDGVAHLSDGTGAMYFGTTASSASPS